MYNRAYGSNFSGGIWNGIKNSFKQGTALTRLIYINIGVFLVIKILEVFFVLAGQRGSNNSCCLTWVFPHYRNACFTRRGR